MKLRSQFPFIRFLALGISLLVCALTGLDAQSTPAADPPPATFRLLSTLGSRTDLKYEPVRGQPPVNLVLSRSLSVPHLRPANGLLRAFRELPLPPDAPPGSRPERQTIFEVRLPPDEPSCLVITQPAGGDPASPFLDARVFSDNPEQHGPGRLLVINLSDVTVALAIDQKNEEFPSGKTTYMQLPNGGGHVVCRAAAADKRGDWTLYYKGEHRLSPYHRGYLIITNYLTEPGALRDPKPPPVRQQLFFEFDPGAVREFQEKNQH